VYTLNRNTQGYAITMGNQSGVANQGYNSVAIGNLAGVLNQSANSIVLNASGSIVDAYNPGFFVSPVQSQLTANQSSVALLGYGTDNQVVQTGVSVRADGSLNPFNVNSTGTMAIASLVGFTANIGIGTTVPGAPLHIYAPQSTVWPFLMSYSSGPQLVIGNGAVYNIIMDTYNTVTGGRPSLCLNTSGGFVGIGFASPGYLLNVQTASGWGIVQQQSDTGPKVGFFTGSGAAYVGTITNHNLNFCTNNSGPQMSITAGTGAVSIGGALSKGSGTFDIEHPLYPNTQKRLCHSFVEGPRCDLIYRGSKTLVAGQAIIDINKECTFRPEDAMDHGTFEALCANPDVFLQNRTGFARVIGSVTAGTLTITCESASSSDTISWMVVAERKDPFIKKWERTDADGYLITQYEGEQV